VLVTHFMEEAERLADRVVLIDRGRVVATDTPAALAGGTRMTFRASIDPAALEALPEVAWLRQEGSNFELGGTEEMVGAVTALLARRGVLAERLRVEQSSLEDAFVELTR
jgi:ABC-2 type transport system ATP-binding protein